MSTPTTHPEPHRGPAAAAAGAGRSTGGPRGHDDDVRRPPRLPARPRDVRRGRPPDPGRRPCGLAGDVGALGDLLHGAAPPPPRRGRVALARADAAGRAARAGHARGDGGRARGDRPAAGGLPRRAGDDGPGGIGAGALCPRGQAGRRPGEPLAPPGPRGDRDHRDAAAGAHPARVGGHRSPLQRGRVLRSGPRRGALAAARGAGRGAPGTLRGARRAAPPARVAADPPPLRASAPAGVRPPGPRTPGGPAARAATA